MNALYIHIPFCVKKCSYCDFNSYAGLEHAIPAYFDALGAEIGLAAEQAGNFGVIKTIYFGGGTPSLPDPELINSSLAKIRSEFVIADDAEITIESNPCSLSSKSLRIYKRAGVNRISIGLQSADDGILKALGRSHDYGQFLKAYTTARECGSQNISVDLIFGVPGQTFDIWADTLRKVCFLQPEHISAYSLTIDENTPIAKEIRTGRLIAADDESDREMYHFAVEFLESNGYKRYEISNFAKPGRISQHNLNYWNNGEYLGFGAGAHSYLNRTRWHNIEDPTGYIASINGGTSVKKDILPVSDGDFMAEHIILRLRTIHGVDLNEFTDLFKRDIYDVHGKTILKFIGQGLLESNGTILKLSDKGLDLANIVMSEFL